MPKRNGWHRRCRRRMSPNWLERCWILWSYGAFAELTRHPAGPRSYRFPLASPPPLHYPIFPLLLPSLLPLAQAAVVLLNFQRQGLLVAHQCWPAMCKVNVRGRQSLLPKLVVLFVRYSAEVPDALESGVLGAAAHQICWKRESCSCLALLADSPHSPPWYAFPPDLPPDPPFPSLSHRDPPKSLYGCGSIVRIDPEAVQEEGWMGVVHWDALAPAIV